MSDLPLYHGTLRGYRYWFASYWLSALTNWNFCWAPSVSTAVCIRDRWWMAAERHPAPERGCTCGFYAWYTPDNDTERREVKTYVARESLAFGVISAWGKIIPGTKGFKAEKAKIEAVTFFDYPDMDPEGVERLAYRRTKCCQTYPDVRFFDTEDEMLAAYPPQEVEWNR